MDPVIYKHGLGDKVIVTMATGSYWRYWQQVCNRNWKAWAQIHRYDVVVFGDVLDTSESATSRPVAWQKLLAMSSPVLLQYAKALWLDADILINRSAPDPLEEMTEDHWGVTIETGSRYSGDDPFVKRTTAVALQDAANKFGLPWEKGYFEAWGFSSLGRPLFNNGVVGFNPQHHRNTILHIYDQWRDGGPGALAEMPPFNLVVQAQAFTILDGRFNRLVFPWSSSWNNDRVRTCQLLKFKRVEQEGERFIKALFEKSYFLHFAGMHRLMASIGPSLVSGTEVDERSTSEGENA